MIKRIIIVILTALVMFTSSVEFVHAEDIEGVGQEQETAMLNSSDVDQGLDYPFGYENPDIFVADTLLGQSTDQDGSSLGFTNFAYAPTTKNYTYKTIAEGIIDKQWLLGGSVFWENASACLDGDFVELATWKQVMYETLLMDWLTYQFESDEFESEFQKSSAKYGWSITKKLIKEGNIYDVDNLGSMSVESAARVLDDEFYEQNKLLGKVSDYIDVISDIQAVTKTSADFYKQVSKVLAVKNACYTRIEFLKKVKEVTDDEDLRNAVDVVVDKFNMATISLEFNEGSFIMGKTVLKMICEQGCKG